MFKIFVYTENVFIQKNDNLKKLYQFENLKIFVNMNLLLILKKSKQTINLKSRKMIYFASFQKYLSLMGHFEYIYIYCVREKYSHNLRSIN